jgi:hypothetical protein
MADKEQEVILRNVLNQMEETGVKDKLLDNLYRFSFQIVKRHLNKAVYGYLFEMISIDDICPMCPKWSVVDDAKTLRNTIKISDNQSEYRLPKKRGENLFGFTASFAVKCVNPKCEWYKDNLIYHGHCVAFLLKNNTPFKTYKHIPPVKDKDLYINPKRLDEIIEKIKKEI